MAHSVIADFLHGLIGWFSVLSVIYGLGILVVAWTEFAGTPWGDRWLPGMLLACLVVLFVWSRGVADFRYHPDGAERLTNWIARLTYGHSLLFGTIPSVIFTGTGFLYFAGRKRQPYISAGLVSLVVSLLVALYAWKYHAIYAMAHPSFHPRAFYRR